MGTTIVAYFITILLYFPMYPGPAPQTGWMQWVYPFPNEVTCEAFLEMEEENLVRLTLMRFQGVPVEIKEMDCMTYQDAYDRNQELGHQGEFNTPPPTIDPQKRLKGVPSA